MITLHKQKSSLHVSKYEKVGSAFLYGMMSILVIYINKIILSSYNFPNFYFIALSQFIATCSVLQVLHMMKRVEITSFSKQIFLEICPVSAMFLGNVVFGLGSTKSLNLPMFTALRRFSIFLTMVGEYIVLSKVPSLGVIVSVSLMIGGALFAAVNDLAFDMHGYTMVFLNNILTAMNGVFLKKASISSSCSKMGVLYYNSLFTAIAIIIYMIVQDLHGNYQYIIDITSSGTSISTSSIEYSTLPTSNFLSIVSFPQWSQIDFVLSYLFASLAGSLLNYSIFLCTSNNSALTTSVIGCLKNILVTYSSMLLMEDYIFHLQNFIGLNISILGSLYYTYVTMYRSGNGSNSDKSSVLPTRIINT